MSLLQTKISIIARHHTAHSLATKKISTRIDCLNHANTAQRWRSRFKGLSRDILQLESDLAAAGYKISITKQK